MNQNTSRPKGRFPFFRILIFLLALGIFIFSAMQLLDYYSKSRKSSQVTQDLRQQAVVTIPQPTLPEVAEKEIPADPDEEPTEPAPTYPAISYTIPLSVDFSLLQAENPDIIGWIYCEDTPINYPIVQAEDNEYYLYRLSDGTSNPNGSIFADFRNLADFTDPNTLLYGHNMKSGAMFASLLKYREQSYYDEHPCLWILTPEQAYRVDLLAGYTTASDSRIYNSFSSTEEMEEILTQAMDNSSFKAQQTEEPVQNIVTLSTCTYEYSTARYVVIGNLVPAAYLPQEELARILDNGN